MVNGYPALFVRLTRKEFNMSANETAETTETVAPDSAPTTRKTRWSGKSATNARHLQNMLRGGDSEYFAALTEGFSLAANGNLEGAVTRLEAYLPEGALAFITQVNSRKSAEEVATAASAEARAAMIRTMFAANILAEAIEGAVISDEEAKSALSDEQYASL